MLVWIEQLCIDAFMHNSNPVLNGFWIKALLPMCRAETAIHTIKCHQLSHIAKTQPLARFGI